MDNKTELKEEDIQKVSGGYYKEGEHWTWTEICCDKCHESTMTIEYFIHNGATTVYRKYCTNPNCDFDEKYFD